MTGRTGEEDGTSRRGLALAAETLAIFAAAAGIGFLALVLLFKAGALAGVGILFYRGLALIGVAAVAVFAALWLAGRRRVFGASIRPRDAFSAAMLSAALNLSFLVVLPVTVDRSITVFMLARMERGAVARNADEIRAAFARIYLGDYQQIERRLAEQTVSGNVAAAPGGFVLTAQGRRFLALSRLVAWMFDTDPRFVSPGEGGQLER